MTRARPSIERRRRREATGRRASAATRARAIDGTGASGRRDGRAGEDGIESPGAGGGGEGARARGRRGRARMDDAGGPRDDGDARDAIGGLTTTTTRFGGSTQT